MTPNERSLSLETTKQREEPLILIVEDHEDTRFLLCYVMEQCGFRVIEAGDGAEALRAAESTVPDLILMDTNLPFVDGLMATRGIRKVASLHTVPIILISGHAQPEARATALATGGNEYFVKPINLADLEMAVKKQLSNNGWYQADRFRSFYQEQLAS